MAIRQLIDESQGDDDSNDNTDTTSLSVNHQLLMSWAWLNIKVAKNIFHTSHSVSVEACTTRYCDNHASPLFSNTRTCIMYEFGYVRTSGRHTEMASLIIVRKHENMNFVLQESSMLLGALVKLSQQLDSRVTILTTDTIHDIGQLFFKILTRCRHRGAIEGCNMGFSAYCTQLLVSSKTLLHQIPRGLLDQVVPAVLAYGHYIISCTSNYIIILAYMRIFFVVILLHVHILLEFLMYVQVLNQLMQSVIMTSSVTRRSAGLPLIVQTILASEHKAKQV